MRIRSVRTPLSFFSVLFVLAITSQAHACLGVSRSVSVNSFSATKGQGPSGGIGLRDKEVVLTFDDGPSAGNTARVLSALSGECTKATFFMVGQMAQANPGMVQRVARAGHTIAHHTHSHANLTHGSPERARAEIQRGVTAVNNALGRYRGRSTRIFRYPYLARSARVDTILRQEGLIPMSASVLSLDWAGGSGPAIVSRVMSKLSQQGRGVILMHDINGRTASILPELLSRLKRGGYRVVHLRSRSYRGSSQRVAKAERKRARGVDYTTTGSVRRAEPRGFFARLRARREARREARQAFNKTRSRRGYIDRTTTGSVRKTNSIGFFARWRARREARRAKLETEIVAKRTERSGSPNSSGPLVIGITRTNEPVRKKGFFARLRERREKREARRRAREKRLAGRLRPQTILAKKRSSNVLLLDSGR